MVWKAWFGANASAAQDSNVSSRAPIFPAVISTANSTIYNGVARGNRKGCSGKICQEYPIHSLTLFMGPQGIGKTHLADQEADSPKSIPACSAHFRNCSKKFKTFNPNTSPQK
jgi:hypothetical protein